MPLDVTGEVLGPMLYAAVKATVSVPPTDFATAEAAALNAWKSIAKILMTHIVSQGMVLPGQAVVGTANPGGLAVAGSTTSPGIIN